MAGQESVLAEMIRLYESGWSSAGIAALQGRSPSGVLFRLKSLVIPLRTREQPGERNAFWRGGVGSDQKTHRVVSEAIAGGDLIAPSACEACGETPRPFADGRRAVHAHHDDYNKPFDIRWLCYRCHYEWHQVHEPVLRSGGGNPRLRRQQVPRPAG